MATFLFFCGAFVLCVGVAIVINRRYDLFDREPIWLMALAVFAGFIALWLLADPLTTATLAAHGPLSLDVATAAVAAVCEDVAKLLLVVLIAAIFPRYLNDPIDGLMYGAAVGLGMAFEEIRAFAARTDTWFQFFGEGVARAAGHLIFGAIIAFPVGLHCSSDPACRRWRAPLWMFCLLFPIGLHFTWDLLSAACTTDVGPPSWRHSLAVALMVVGMLVFGVLVAVGSAFSKRILAPNSPVLSQGERTLRILRWLRLTRR